MPGVDFLSTVTKTVSYEEPSAILAIIIVVTIVAIGMLNRRKWSESIFYY